MDSPNLSTTTEPAQAQVAAAPADPAPAQATAEPQAAQNAAPDPAPETQEGAALSLDIPDNAPFDPALLDEFKALATREKMPQQLAQEMINLGAKHAGLIISQAQQAKEQEWAAWAEQTRADPEIGGEQMDANLALAKKAMLTFGTPELTEIIDTSGLGNHPALIKAFFKIGKAISEDTLLPGGAQVPAAKPSLAQQLYPNMNP